MLVGHSLCSDILSCWEGDIIHIKPTAEATISLAQIQVDKHYFHFFQSVVYSNF